MKGVEVAVSTRQARIHDSKRGGGVHMRSAQGTVLEQAKVVSRSKMVHSLREVRTLPPPPLWQKFIWWMGDFYPLPPSPQTLVPSPQQKKVVFGGCSPSWLSSGSAMSLVRGSPNGVIVEDDQDGSEERQQASLPLQLSSALSLPAPLAPPPPPPRASSFSINLTEPLACFFFYSPLDMYKYRFTSPKYLTIHNPVAPKPHPIVLCRFCCARA